MKNSLKRFCDNLYLQSLQPTNQKRKSFRHFEVHNNSVTTSQANEHGYVFFPLKQRTIRMRERNCFGTKKEADRKFMIIRMKGSLLRPIYFLDVFLNLFTCFGKALCQNFASSTEKILIWFLSASMLKYKILKLVKL